MKPLVATALVASLGLNAALAFYVLTGSARAEADAATQAAAASAAAEAKAAAKGPAPIDAKTWASLDTPDLPELVNRLRAAGFPRDAIRSIIAALVSEKYTARMMALDPDSEKRPFWKDGGATDNKVQLAIYRLYQEQQKAIRAVLGEDPPTSPLALARQRAQFGDIPSEKVSALQEILRLRGEKQTETYYTKGNMSNDERAALERETRDKIAAVLTPAELEEYDMRNSNIARQARNDLLTFNPSEQEFRAIVKMRQPLEQFSNYGGFPSQQDQQRRSDLEKEINQQIVSSLGPERGAQYTQSNDYSYRQTAQLVARLELPPETTGTLAKIQQDFNERRSKLYQGVTDPAGRAALTPQLVALQQEASAAVVPILGSASRVEAYKQYGGNWITYLVPQAPRAAAPAAVPKQ